MKRIAVSVSNNRLSEFFGQCDEYRIFDVGRKINREKTVALPKGILAEELPSWLEKQGITDVIAFRVNPKIIRLLASKKVNLYIGVPADSPRVLIDKYLQGRLESDETIIKELIDNDL